MSPYVRTVKTTSGATAVQIVCKSRRGSRDALERACRVLGFAEATGGDEVFFQLVAARIIEPVSKLDSALVLEEAGAAAVSYRTVTRRLREYAKQGWREKLAVACAAHARLGRASLVLYA